MKDPEFQRIILSGWKDAGVTKALSNGSIYFLSLIKSPLNKIDPFATRHNKNFLRDKITGIFTERISKNNNNREGNSDIDPEVDLE